MKFAILLVTVLLSGIFANAEERTAAKFNGRLELQEFTLYAENAKSIDLLIDYEKVKVDCHGLRFNYTTIRNPESGRIYVEKRALPRKAIPCPRDYPMRDMQGGLKIKLNSKSEFGVFAAVAVYSVLGATDEVKVEYVVTKK